MATGSWLSEPQLRGFASFGFYDLMTLGVWVGRSLGLRSHLRATGSHLFYYLFSLPFSFFLAISVV